MRNREEKLVSRSYLEISSPSQTSAPPNDSFLIEKATRDFDDLTPLDARDSLLMDHPQRKEFAEMNNFNFTGPHESYQDEPRRARSPSNTESAGLVHNDYGVAHGRSTSADSHGLRGSIEGRHPTAPGYGMAY